MWLLHPHVPFIKKPDWKPEDFYKAFRVAIRNMESYDLQPKYVVMGTAVLERLLGGEALKLAANELHPERFRANLTDFEGYGFIVDPTRPHFAAVFPEMQVQTLEGKYQVLINPEFKE